MATKYTGWSLERINLCIKKYKQELKDMNESNMEGIINLAKDNMMSNVYDIIDRVDVKEV